MNKRSTLSVLALAATAALTLTACGGGADPLGDDGSSASADAFIIGSADFPESQLLATIYAQALQAADIEATTRLNIGSREVYMPALLDGSINLLPEYAGAVLSYLDDDATATAPDEVLAALEVELPEGISMLAASDAQDGDVLGVTQATADEFDLVTLEDLAPVGDQLTFGGAPEMQTRHEGIVGLESVYGVTFREFRSLDVAGPLTLTALENGQIQVASLNSTTPAIARDGLVVLEDTKNLFRAQNILPIIAADMVTDEVVQVLDAVSAALTTEDLIEMNKRLDDLESVDAVAADWISEHGLG